MTRVLSRGLPGSSSAPALPASPWLVSDTFGVAVVNLVGLGLLLAGTQGARHTTDPHDLLLLVDVAAGGLVVALAGNAVFLLSALRHVGALRTELLGTRAPSTAEVVVPAPVSSDALVSAESMTRYHRSGCPAVRGKVVFAAPLAKHLQAGREACGLCSPTGGAA